MNLDELLNNPHSKKRLELIAKSAEMTKHLSVEEMLLRGFALIAFSKANLFTIKEE